MAKHLTQNDIELVVNFIDGWKSKLTWQGIVDKYAELTGRTTTRQTLERNEDIYSAYRNRRWGKKSLSTRRVVSLAVAIEIIDVQDITLSRHNLLLDGYKAKFARWIYNASKKGISVDNLNQKLPTIDRGRTDQ